MLTRAPTPKLRRLTSRWEGLRVHAHPDNTASLAWIRNMSARKAASTPSYSGYCVMRRCDSGPMSPRRTRRPDEQATAGATYLWCAGRAYSVCEPEKFPDGPAETFTLLVDFLKQNPSGKGMPRAVAPSIRSGMARPTRSSPLGSRVTWSWCRATEGGAASYLMLTLNHAAMVANAIHDNSLFWLGSSEATFPIVGVYLE